MKTKESETTQEINSIELKENQLPTFSNIDWDKLEKAKNVQSLNFDYLKLEVGECLRGIFAGIFEQEVNGRNTKIVGIYAKNGSFCSASTMIVQSCEKLNPGDALEIIFKGEKSISGGRKLGDYEINKVIF